MISVIVPVYNEEQTLRAKKDYYQDLAKNCDLIFVDGGSEDQTVDIANQLATVIHSAKGRFRQMNLGAAESKGEWLLFHHADSRLDISSLDSIAALHSENDIVGGCFDQVIEHSHLIYRWIAFTGNMRARWSGVFYGDQGIFVRKDIFHKIQGFPNVAIGEDILFTKALRMLGRVQVIPRPIYSSPRRWQQQGILKTSWLNWRISWGLMRGKTNQQLADLYQDIR